jgi:hypothetical protein
MSGGRGMPFAMVFMPTMRGRSSGGMAASMCSPRRRRMDGWRDWCAGHAEPDVEVAPEVVEGTGEGGGEGSGVVRIIRRFSLAQRRAQSDCFGDA